MNVGVVGDILVLLHSNSLRPPAATWESECRSETDELTFSPVALAPVPVHVHPHAVLKILLQTGEHREMGGQLINLGWQYKVPSSR